MTYKKETNMKKFIVIVLMLLTGSIYGQQILTDANFEKAIEGRSAFSDDNI